MSTGVLKTNGYDVDVDKLTRYFALCSEVMQTLGKRQGEGWLNNPEHCRLARCDIEELERRWGRHRTENRIEVKT